MKINWYFLGARHIMTLTKSDIVDSVLKQFRLKNQGEGKQQYLFPEFDYTLLSKRRAAEFVNTTFEIIKQSLEKGEDTTILGFGKFKVKNKWARKGRNPRTGEQLILKSRRVVTFRCSPRLKDKINK